MRLKVMITQLFTSALSLALQHPLIRSFHIKTDASQKSYPVMSVNSIQKWFVMKFAMIKCQIDLINKNHL